MKHFKHLLMHGCFREMLHEIKEYTFVEFAGLVGHLMKNSIKRLIFLALSKLMKNYSISGVVVVKTLLG